MPETVERVKPSVVAVGTWQKTRNPAFQFRGTGFAVGDGTLVATNAHVLPDVVNLANMESIVVMLAPGPGRQGPEPRQASVAAVDKDHDLALLKLDGRPLPALALADSTIAREGQIVAFTGFPVGSVLGLFAATHRAMIASITPIALPSASARQLDARVIRRLQGGAFVVFQLDATAYPGNSGSPLYDAETGAVIGIVNMVFVKGTKEAALTHPTGISFAIPATHLQELLRSVR